MPLKDRLFSTSGLLYAWDSHLKIGLVSHSIRISVRTNTLRAVSRRTSVSQSGYDVKLNKMQTIFLWSLLRCIISANKQPQNSTHLPRVTIHKIMIAESVRQK